MEVFLTIFFMAAIGAIIGGVTNSLAIKMLFRPYEAKYIGKWRVPFTPGLIPKRRNELAKQMGLLVVNHLVTPDSIKKKLIDAKLQKEMESSLKEFINHVIQSENSIQDYLKKLNLDDLGSKVEEKFFNVMERKMDKWIHENRHQTIRDAVPGFIWEWVDEKTPSISSYLMNAIKNYLESEKGKNQLQSSIDQYLDNKGVFGGLVNMVIGKGNLHEKIHGEIVKIISAEENYTTLNQLIRDELQKIKDKPINEFLNRMNEDEVKTKAMEYLKSVISVDTLLNKPISEWFTDSMKESAAEKVAPFVVQLITEQLSNYVPVIVEKLQVVEMVQNQVDSFPIERIEEMVLGITKKELKMITFLGAYLGGLIGIIQGVIVLFI